MEIQQIPIMKISNVSTCKPAISKAFAVPSRNDKIFSSFNGCKVTEALQRSVT